MLQATYEFSAVILMYVIILLVYHQYLAKFSSLILMIISMAVTTLQLTQHSNTIAADMPVEWRID